MRKWIAWFMAAVMLLSTGAVAEVIVPEGYQQEQPLLYRPEAPSPFRDEDSSAL